jgi:general secretion pathway protein G
MVNAPVLSCVNTTRTPIHEPFIHRCCPNCSILGGFCNLAASKDPKRILTDSTPASIVLRQISFFGTALNMFDLELGRYPTTAEDLEALIKRPATFPKGRNWHPYLQVEKLPKDPWGHDYCYCCPGLHNSQGFDVYSLGQNGKGGDKAIGNWTAPER